MTQKIPRRFDFARDAFAFANELLWEYQFDPARAEMNFRPREPRPNYAHRCFVLTRAARQFLYHARFESEEKTVGDEIYRRLIGEILSKNPRKPSENPLTIPGFDSLRTFSAVKENLLKSECGGAWRSYILRSHWRMLFPISREHQNQTANELLSKIQNNFSPIVHLVKFPSLTINHGMILFGATESESEIQFSAYDPNLPQQSAQLIFNRAARTFSLPPNCYWRGGELNVIEIFRNWIL